MAALLTYAAFAIADTVTIDGDTDTVGVQNPREFTAAPGDVIDFDAGFRVNYQGSRHLATGSSISFSVNAGQTTLPAGYSVGSTTAATVPSGTSWNDNSDTFDAGTSAVQFTVPAGANEGDVLQYDIKWTASHTCATTNCLNEPALKVKVTVGGNTAPTVTLDGDDSVNEGDIETYDYTVTDPDDDPDDSTDDPVVTTDCGANGTKSNDDGDSFDCRFPDGPNTSVVSVTANDGEADPVSESIEVDVANVAPVAVLNGADSADEGEMVNYTYSASDVGDDTLSITTSCGSNATKDNDDGDSFDCTFIDGPGTSDVSVTATETDGDALNDEHTASITVNVANVAPTAVLNGDGDLTADEGEMKSYTYSASDPGDDTLTVVADCGSNATKDNDDGDSFDCTFIDGPGTSDVSVTATETDGDALNDEDTASITVNVANVNPLVGDLVLTNGTGTACLAGNTVKLDFGFSDPGVNDSPWAVNIDWGDGSTDTSYNATSQGAQPQQSHTYSGAGAHQIVVTVTDKDSGAGQSDTTDGNVSFLYNMTGILAPFNADGSSVWKYGSTLPVKVRITDCNNTPVSNLKPRVWATLLNPATPSDGVSETPSTSAADTTGYMRYSDGQYIYNFASKYLADGNATYYMNVRGTDAAGNVVTNPGQVNVRFALKTK